MSLIGAASDASWLTGIWLIVVVFGAACAIYLMICWMLLPILIIGVQKRQDETNRLLNQIRSDLNRIQYGIERQAPPPLQQGSPFDHIEP